MPYCKCPRCKHTYHLAVRDVAAWYREHAPGAEPGALVEKVCLFCMEPEEKFARVVKQEDTP